MPCNTFISYHGLDKNVALQIKKKLEQHDFTVVMYNPGLRWDDAPSTVVIEIEKSDCIIYLNTQPIPSEWVKAELEWAEVNKIPIFQIRYPSELPGIIPKISALKEKVKFNLPEGDRWYQMKRIFFARVDEDEVKRSDEFATHATQYKQMQQSMNAGYELGCLLNFVFRITGIIALISSLLLYASYLFWGISYWWSVGTLLLAIPSALIFLLGRKLMKASDDWDDKYVRNDDENENYL